MYDLILLENNKEVNKMKEKIDKFEGRVHEKLDEFERSLEEKVEVRLETITRAFLARTSKAADKMFEEKNEIIMLAVAGVNENLERMRGEHKL